MSDADLDGLRARLRAPGRPEPWPRSEYTGPRAGVDDGELIRLAAYWADGYDWRAHEAEINALASRFADVGGTAVHYVRFDGERPDALPIVLTHGWPRSFLELVTLANRPGTGETPPMRSP